MTMSQHRFLVRRVTPPRGTAEEGGKKRNEELNSSVEPPDTWCHVRLSRGDLILTSKEPRRVSSIHLVARFIAACDIVRINPDIFGMYNPCASVRGARVSRVYVIRKSINPIPCTAS